MPGAQKRHNLGQGEAGQPQEGGDGQRIPGGFGVVLQVAGTGDEGFVAAARLA